MDKNYNQLPTDIKLLIVQAKTLVDETREKIKLQENPLDITCRFQLRDDCKCVEKYIKKLQNSRTVEEDANKLQQAVIRLQTSATGILRG